ncbi:MAG: RIP metalloprotease RseP, partial [Candidatus Omnitrophica bacterium]|nr:RIP metalloprotease RseP [Candidatus Omnitrophota bacterium]
GKGHPIQAFKFPVIYRCDALSLFAGPAFNYILAFLIFSVIFMFGSPTMTTEVGGLLSGYPAQSQGIKVGDKIVAIDGKSVKYWEDMTEIIHKHVVGTVRLTVERSGKTFDKEIKPIVRQTKDIFGKEVKMALVGIAPSQKIEKVRYGFFRSFYMGGKKLFELTAVTYKALFAIVTGRLSFKESMTGPIGIFMITGRAAEMGIIYILYLMAVLSASLAIFNLLPLPVLDGGHIIFLALEKVRGRPLSPRTQEAITNVGIGFLVLLMVFIFYSDIMKFGIAAKVGGIFKR